MLVDQHKDCSAEGYPCPDVVLSHNDGQIKDTDGSLIKITSETEKDAGVNSLGCDNETCLTLDINCK